MPDETGWRIGGRLAWLHVAVSQDAVAYLIARQRGFEASAVLIGRDYTGKTDPRRLRQLRPVLGGTAPDLPGSPPAALPGTSGDGDAWSGDLSPQGQGVVAGGLGDAGPAGRPADHRQRRQDQGRPTGPNE